MLGYIKGKIFKVEPNWLLVVNQGLGYKIFVLPGDYKVGQEVEFYLYHQVRETEQALYGFFKSEQQMVFELLLSVSGIGPKKAMDILIKADYRALIGAVKNEDKKALQMNGLTPVMADKVLSGLKNKVKNLNWQTETKTGGNEELIEALQKLGYEDRVIMRVLPQIKPNLALSDQVKEALKLLIFS